MPIMEHMTDAERAHLTPIQQKRLKHWTDLQDTLNRGDFVGMDAFFHPEFTYANPNRPDLGTYQSWKTSPEALYNTFPPSKYATIDAVGKGDDEIWILGHHYGKQTGGPYMGVPANGQEINVKWFSIVRFKDDKIVHIYSISDVLSMLQDIGVKEIKQPTDPYK
ncbi:MAG: ester cyclase [Porticoccaceae bacterium]